MALNAFDNGVQNPQLLVKKNWKIGTLAGDAQFPPPTKILTWTGQGKAAGWQWIGYRNSRFSFKLLKFHFFIKFEATVPAASKNFGIKVYGQIHNKWVATCKPDVWCEVTETHRAPETGDGNHVLLIFDTVATKQVVHIADFSIGMLIGPTNNIARFQPSFQSRWGWNAPASRAVDGNTGNGEWGSGSCTHTHRVQNAKWFVNLGKYFEIEKVVVYNRKRHGERLNNFVVTIKDAYRCACNGHRNYLGRHCHEMRSCTDVVWSFGSPSTLGSQCLCDFIVCVCNVHIIADIQYSFFLLQDC